MLERLIWAEINLTNYIYNFSSVKQLLSSGAQIIAVCKANAYGHGIIPIAKQAEKLGASHIGVVCLYEGKILREAGIKIPILVMNYTDAESVEKAVDLDLTLNVMDESVLKRLDTYARKKNKQAVIHIKIDTGMHRLGLSPEKALQFIYRIEQYKNIQWEGVFTHFATADEKDLSFAKQQLHVFHTFLDSLSTEPPIIHAANSAAALRMPQAHFTHVRPGIILYGLAPASDFSLPFTPKPVMSLKTKIVQIKEIGEGESVGYGRAFIAKKRTVVAILPGGYGDGLRRATTNFGEILVKGKRAPIIGRVSMDQTTIDVSEISNIAVGDEVVLIGSQGSQTITAEDIAKRLGTINYEVVSAITERVSRVYIE